MRYVGDFSANSTVYLAFTLNTSAGAAVDPSGTFETADMKVYKNSSATQRTSEVGFSITIPFDTTTGLGMVSIDTSDNTDVGFYATGNDYTVVLSPDTETVDGQSIVAILGQFSIENRHTTAGAPSASTVADAVWDEATSGHVAGGTFGEQCKSDIDAILEDTNEIGVAGISLTDLGGMSAGMKAAVNAEVDGALNTAIPGSPTADSVNERVKAIDAKLPTGDLVDSNDILTTALTEAYAADGSPATLSQLLYMLWSSLSEFGISGTTITAKKLDGSTTSMTFTLDDDASPTSRTRAT